MRGDHMASGVVKSWITPSGSITQDGKSYAGAYWSFEWSSSKVSAGVTKIDWVLYTKGRSESPTLLSTSCLLKITGSDGTSKTLYDKGGDTGTGTSCYFTGVQQSSGSFNISHKTDGSASFDVYFRVHMWSWTRMETTETVTLDNNKPGYTVSVTTGTGISDVSGTGLFLEGSSVTLEATISTGYTFSHWTYNNTNYTANPWTVTTNITSDIDISAHATENKLTVNYNGNGATYGNLENVDIKNPAGDVLSLDYLYSTYYEYGLNNVQNMGALYLSRRGYTANGNWMTSPNGGTILSDATGYSGKTLAEAVGMSIADGNKAITVYAQWVPINYTIKYVLNGGTTSHPTTETANYDTDYTVIQSYEISRPGYRLIGWTTNSDGTPDGHWTNFSNYWTGIAGDADWGIDSNNTVTLYAMWEECATIHAKVDGEWKIGSPYVKWTMNGEKVLLFMSKLMDSGN